MIYTCVIYLLLILKASVQNHHENAVICMDVCNKHEYTSEHLGDCCHAYWNEVQCEK